MDEKLPADVAAPAYARVAALLAALAATLLAAPSLACDLCAIYSATEGASSRTGIRLGLAEQYTQFTTEQLDGHEVPNVFGEHLYSSNSQLFAGYQFNRRFGLQLNLPILYHGWRRVLSDGQIQTSQRGGIGDMSLLANALVYDSVGEDGVFSFGVLGGLKFPTGDSGFLKEELDETAPVASLARRRERPQHEGHDDEFPSGVHGHDLTFGSGSVDGIVGAQLYASYRRFFFSVAAQYKATTEGSFEYQFANDLTWTGGPGYFLLLDHDYTLSLAGVLSGETKGNDEQAGVHFDDTAITALYCGPGFDFTWGTSLTAEVAADLPVVQNNTGLQIVPDFRLRGAFVWRF
jgi:hypothetical protein